jgi:hypothetical protein
MRIMKKVGRVGAVSCVVLLSIVAGVFLAACRHLPWWRRAPGPPCKPPEAAAKPPEGAKTPEAKPAEKPAEKPAPKKSRVDVDETERGQPIPRNLAE